MDWFPRRHARGRPPHPDVLTPAEWRVLEHLREGLPNAEIAERLGVSVNTVRTHVSSMLAKLELPDRTALAAWHGEPAPASRSALGRLVAGFPLGWFGRGVSGAGPAVAVAAVAAIGALAIAGAASLSGGSGEAPATETATATAAASVTPSFEPTPEPSSEPTPTGTPEPPLLRGDIEGWFTEERPSPPSEVRAVQPRPPSPLEPYDRESGEVVLYDTLTMTERNLGEGGMPRFSPDGSMLAWVTGEALFRVGELRVLELGTGDEWSLGEARAIAWSDAETILAFGAAAGDRELVNARTGSRVATTPNMNPTPVPEQESGYRLEEVEQHEPYPFWRRTYLLTNVATGETREFDAYRAVLAPDGTVYLATVSEPSTRIEPTEGPHVGSHTSNIFEIDPATGVATFIATAYPSYPSWPFDVSADHVMWTDRACNLDDDAVTRLYERQSGELVDLSDHVWAEFTPDGHIAYGTFGADGIIDIETLQYRVVLPWEFRDNFWTPDYRYSAVGLEGGHGGVC